MLEKPYKRLRDKNGFIRDECGRYKYALTFRMAGRGSRKINRRAWFKNDLEAAAEVARLRGDAGAIAGRTTWTEALHLFMESKGPTLTEDYRHKVRVAVEYVRSRCGDAIERTSLAAFTETLREKARTSSGARANRIRAMVLSVARFAEREGLLASIPFKASPPRPHKKKERTPIPLARFSDYYAAMDEFARPLFLALAASGDRVTAICKIDVPDIHASEGWVEVTKKGGKRRRIPLSKPFLRAIRMAVDMGQKVKIQKQGAVFVNKSGRRWDVFSFRLALMAACKRAGLPYHTPHTLRNLLASSLAEQDANRYTISASLGHDHTGTADIYVKAREELLAAERGLRSWADLLMEALPNEI
jgi:integrase